MNTESTITIEELARQALARQADRDEDAFWRELYIVCLTKGWPPEEAAQWADKALQPAQNRDRI